MPKLPPVQPYDPGANAVVRPLEGPYHQGDQELRLFDAWAVEESQTSGTVLFYYSLDVGASQGSALYDESTRRVYRGPFKVSGYVEWPKSNPVVQDAGMVVKWNTRMWIPRAEIERARCPLPLEGDVVRAWQNPFFDLWSLTGDEPQIGGYFFTVVVCNEEGHLYDQPGFVGFELTVSRSTDFTPERRLDNLRPP